MRGLSQLKVTIPRRKRTFKVKQEVAVPSEKKPDGDPPAGTAETTFPFAEAGSFLEAQGSVKPEVGYSLPSKLKGAGGEQYI